MRTEPGFLGTNAPLSADLTLIAYLLLIVPAMLIGFYFARRKWFEPHHKLVMTVITILNWVLILLVMAVSYSENVAPGLSDNINDRLILIPLIHLIFGATAQLLATYLVIRMWLEKSLPDWFKVKNIKRYMRLTLFLWLLTASVGAFTYFTWYVVDTSASTQIVPPVTTEEVPGVVLTEEITLEPVTTEEIPAVIETETAPQPVVTEDASTCIIEEQTECEAEYQQELADCAEEDADKQAECQQDAQQERAECLGRVADRCE
ncbi:MAG: hypothetical protein D6711_10240 [Chloroflexi bacterium]|nr:MAG: hypothetical protein D6711_10240 [Chloroflexota bacterium]